MVFVPVIQHYFVCLTGHSCPKGSPAMSACPSGSYHQNVGQGVCVDCPAEMYCDQMEAVAELQSGANASSHGIVMPKTYPAGYSCPNSTQTDRENPCPLGTFGNFSGLESQSDCSYCTAGSYCPAEGLNSSRVVQCRVHLCTQPDVRLPRRQRTGRPLPPVLLLCGGDGSASGLSYGMPCFKV